jgi:DNA-directed RNA polymerase specialized sigma24 family protein
MPIRAGQASSLSSAAGKMPSLLSDDTKRTATVERIPDQNSFDLEAAWDTEWQKNLWDAALARVKTQFKPKQFQMFDLYVLKEWPVKEVARALGVTATHVYVMKHRVSSALKKEIFRLKRMHADMG